jgi:hypothetical protein
VLCFNPEELNSKLANAWIGYVPTPQAILHGGYSAQSSWVTKLVPDAGWTIVEKTRELLVEAFAEG